MSDYSLFFNRDSVWNGVAQWLGIEDPDDLQKVCPNRGNFLDELFTEADMFASAENRR